MRTAPPGIDRPPAPLFGAATSLALATDPLGLLERAARLGDVVGLRAVGVDAVLVNHPEGAWEVLVTNAKRMRKGPTADVLRRVLGDGLLTSEDPVHRRQRQLLQPAFSREAVAGYAIHAADLAARRADRWIPGRPIDLVAQMRFLALEIVVRALFGAGVDAGRAAAVADAIGTMVDGMRRLRLPGGRLLERVRTPGVRGVERARDDLDRELALIVAEGRDDTSLAGSLRSAGDPRQVRDELMTLLVAGHETTAAALAFAWEAIAASPPAEAALHAELDDVLAGRDPAPTDLEELPFTGAIVHETLRLFPPSWAIARRCRERSVLAGTPVPEGTTIVVSPWLLHRDPRWWNDASSFLPERWGVRERGAHRPSERGAYLPFGAGPRACIGAPLANAELVLALATIGRRWRLRPVSADPLRLQAVVTLRPRGSRWVVPVPR
ncbi:MAG: cytochrome P450 [Actinomycetota bacterium]